MHDHVETQQCIFKGYGHYHEIYVKLDGVWKIKRTHTTRLRWEEHWHIGGVAASRDAGSHV
jgi:hypothetical protein